MTTEEFVIALTERFPDIVPSEFRGQTRVLVPRAAAFDVLAQLQGGGFDLLVDITCVDYLNFREATDRFGLVYLLASTQSWTRLTVRVMLNEPDLEMQSVTPLWQGANWLEREVWDLFGIHFTGHPNLKRILLPDEFAAFPLRKDYPLQGRGERHNFPVLTRGGA